MRDDSHSCWWIQGGLGGNEWGFYDLRWKFMWESENKSHRVLSVTFPPIWGLHVRQKRIWVKSDAPFSTNFRLDKGAVDWRKAGRGDRAVGIWRCLSSSLTEFCATEQEPGNGLCVSQEDQLPLTHLHRIFGQALSHLYAHCRTGWVYIQDIVRGT